MYIYIYIYIYYIIYIYIYGRPPLIRPTSSISSIGHPTLVLKPKGNPCLDFLIQNNRKSGGDGSGGSWSKFLPFSLLQVMENH